MFDLSPAVLFSGLLIGTLRLAMLIYGKKQEDIPTLLGGLALSIVPLLATSLLALWVLTAAVVTGVWALHHHA